MFKVQDPATPSGPWAALWARLTIELLASQAALEKDGEAHWGDDLDAWVTEHGFEQALPALVQCAYARPHADFELAVDIALKQMPSADYEDLAGRLYSALEEAAAIGRWFDPVGLDESFGTDLSGETLLFSMGFTVTCPLELLMRTIESPVLQDAIAGALIRDSQIMAGHRLLVFPTLIDAPGREQLDNWHVNKLREQLEDWMTENPTGHPSVSAATQMLENCGLSLTPSITYTGTDGVTVHDVRPRGLGMQSLMLLGLLAQTPDQADASSQVPFVLRAVNFPRAEVGPLLDSLSNEASIANQDLETAEEAGSAEAVAFLNAEMRRIEKEVAAIEATFGGVVTPHTGPGLSPHAALESLVQRAIAPNVKTPCVDALSHANEFFMGWQDLVFSHRRVAFHALLAIAAMDSPTEELNGTVARLEPGDSPGEVKVNLSTASGDKFAVLLWPPVQPQSLYDSFSELVSLLKPYGIRSLGTGNSSLK